MNFHITDWLKRVRNHIIAHVHTPESALLFMSDLCTEDAKDFPEQYRVDCAQLDVVPTIEGFAQYLINADPKVGVEKAERLLKRYTMEDRHDSVYPPLCKYVSNIKKLLYQSRTTTDYDQRTYFVRGLTERLRETIIRLLNPSIANRYTQTVWHEGQPQQITYDLLVSVAKTAAKELDQTRFLNEESQIWRGAKRQRSSSYNAMSQPRKSARRQNGRDNRTRRRQQSNPNAKLYAMDIDDAPTSSDDDLQTEVEDVTDDEEQCSPCHNVDDEDDDFQDVNMPPELYRFSVEERKAKGVGKNGVHKNGPYAGTPVTCDVCNDNNHLRNECPKHLREKANKDALIKSSHRQSSIRKMTNTRPSKTRRAQLNILSGNEQAIVDPAGDRVLQQTTDAIMDAQH
jgi:hypothetical protein